MKRGKQLTIGLLMCALLAGLLSGCGAGGGKTASATEAAVKAEAGSYASETMAAQSQWDGAVMEAEGPPLSHNTEEYNYIAENAFLAVANASAVHLCGGRGHGLLRQYPAQNPGGKQRCPRTRCA